jgi:hypothetical protein
MSTDIIYTLSVKRLPIFDVPGVAGVYGYMFFEIN